jgi:hypothetical protein
MPYLQQDVNSKILEHPFDVALLIAFGVMGSILCSMYILCLLSIQDKDRRKGVEKEQSHIPVHPLGPPGMCCTFTWCQSMSMHRADKGIYKVSSAYKNKYNCGVEGRRWRGEKAYFF